MKSMNSYEYMIITAKNSIYYGQSDLLYFTQMYIYIEFQTLWQWYYQVKTLETVHVPSSWKRLVALGPWFSTFLML